MQSSIKPSRSREVTHNDLKPANILFNTDDSSVVEEDHTRFRLIDFGFSTIGNEITPLVGTPYYMSPLMIDQKCGDNIDYRKANDYWALSVLYYQYYFYHCGAEAGVGGVPRTTPFQKKLTKRNTSR